MTQVSKININLMKKERKSYVVLVQNENTAEMTVMAFDFCMNTCFITYVFL